MEKKKPTAHAIVRAWLLADAHHHAWASPVTESLMAVYHAGGRAAVEHGDDYFDAARRAVEQVCEGHLPPGWGRGMFAGVAVDRVDIDPTNEDPGRPPRTIAEVCALNAATVRSVCHGFPAPTRLLFADDGSSAHMTSTGRTRWRVDADGRVDVEIHRPHGLALSCSVAPHSTETVIIVEPQIEIHGGHLDALARVFFALGVEPSNWGEVYMALDESEPAEPLIDSSPAAEAALDDES